ncbi:DUF3880 domain-containing protein [Arthrobacter sp. YAF17]|uniref:CgeB family protein n=1 Tax=Arthrobacter sp. YAF17 TaxID=3233077 RepID=UPI003F8E408E
MLRTILDKPRTELQRTWHNSPAGMPTTDFRLDPRLPSTSTLGLLKRSRWLIAEVVGNSDLTIRVDVGYELEHVSAKAGVVWVKFLDRNGRELTSEAKLASGKNGHYIYLVPGPEGVPAFVLRTPTGCASVALGFAAWKAAPGTISIRNSITIEQTVCRPLPRKSDGLAQPLTGQVVISPEEDWDWSLLLEKSPVWCAFSVQDSKDLEAALQVLDSSAFGSSKAGIVMVKFLDKSGTDVSSRVEIPTGPHGDYFYINPGSDGQFRFRLHAPESCVTVQLGVAAWNASAQRLRIRNGLSFVELPASAADGLPPALGPIQSEQEGLLFDPQSARASLFTPTKKPAWIRVATKGQQSFQLTLEVPRATSMDTAKSGLLRVEYVTANGKTKPVAGLKLSKEYGAYAYLDARSVGAQTFKVAVPPSAVELRVAVQSWEDPLGQLRVTNELRLDAAVVENGKKPNVPAKAHSVRSTPRSPREIKVAVICDEFTFNSFKYEFTPIVLDPATWREQLEGDRPDFFLCESAWSGVDSQTRPWKGKIYASSNFESENRRELLAILQWCRTENIPTAFWNKEDPTHYPDRVHDFVDTALKFDHVFTTDRDCIEKYRRDYGHPSVHCLPFATQPKLFNPIGGSSRTAEVIFAGSWYANHEDRSTEMLTIFRQIQDAGMGFKIYDRFYGSADELHSFPPELRSHTLPAVSHAELAAVYKSSLLGLNINTVTGSPTMFARRAFELMSSNTLVLSNDFAAADEFFGDTLVKVGQNFGGLQGLTRVEINEKRDSALHNVLEHHTYGARFLQILDVIGLEYRRPDDRLTIVYPISNSDDALAALSSFSRFTSVAQGVLLLISAEVPNEEVRQLYSQFNKYGATVTSVALARTQKVCPESLVPTAHFALLSPYSEITPEQIRRAKLHVGYVETPIALGSDLKYEFSSVLTISDLIAPRNYMETVLEHHGASISGDFYHV